MYNLESLDYFQCGIMFVYFLGICDVVQCGMFDFLINHKR